VPARRKVLSERTMKMRMHRTAGPAIALLGAITLAGCPQITTDDGSGATGASGTTGAVTGAAGSAAASSGSASCATLDGVYAISFTEHSGGTCGPRGSEVDQFINGQPAPSATQNCTGGQTPVSACVTQRQQVCQVSDLSGAFLGSLQLSGTLTQVANDTQLQGTINITLTDTTGHSCSSTYDLSGVRD
jgi:hypothetical protein